MFKTSSFILELADFFMCSKRQSIQIGCFFSMYSFLINLLIFCLKATLLSLSVSTNWGTICSRIILGVCKISYKIFRETKATLKLASPSNLINIGTNDFIKVSVSNSYLDIWNLVCSYSIAYNLAFQSLSFFKS